MPNVTDTPTQITAERARPIRIRTVINVPARFVVRRGERFPVIQIESGMARGMR